MRIRNILARAVALGLALPILAPAAYAAPAQIAFPPPAGMTITTGTPGNGLELRVNATSDPRFLRQLSPYRTSERPGTIVVDTGAHFLYLVLGNGWAMRYGIGVARDGFEWSGTHNVTAKREWPGWTPPAEMRQRKPGLPEYMEGGAENPLGARALYLYRHGKDTKYRIHGTSNASTIGRKTSAGCIRLFNQDAIDLFDRVPLGTRVLVRSPEQSLAAEGAFVELENGYLVPAGSPEALAFEERQAKAAEAEAEVFTQIN